MEHKVFRLGEIKFAEGEGAAAMEFSGYGAVFGNVDSYGDVIAPGAFADTLAEARSTGNWPAMLSQHGAMGLTSEDLTPVGVWTDMAEDGHGLKMTGVLADTQRGIELYKLMKMKPRPAINGLSIGYIAKAWTPRTKPEDPRRTLTKVHLIETSPVTFPANGKARVTDVKSEGFTERDFERWLMQDAGLTRTEARVVINQGFKSLIAMRDAGSSELAEVAEALRRREAATPR
jgi:HK97 family phage prohead protease